MGREVRKVPADWVHPKYPEDHYETHRRGCYVPLFEAGFDQAETEWAEGYARWQAGLVESYAPGEKWVPKREDHVGRYTDHAGARPSPDDYMPTWPEERRTHFMMYEDTSEGTPISPAFATPEELARWLADTAASSFAGMPATYEQWLRVAQGGYAPSLVVQGGHMQSGVAALATNGRKL